jgi:hypothetical protein
MPDAKKDSHHAAPTFTREDLVILYNALNEVCNGLPFEDDEFQTRIGYSRATAQKLLEKIAKALAR